MCQVKKKDRLLNCQPETWSRLHSRSNAAITRPVTLVRPAETGLSTRSTDHKRATRTTFTRTILLNLLTKLFLGSNLSQLYHTLYLLTVLALAKSLRLILEISATYRLICYLLANI